MPDAITPLLNFVSTGAVAILAAGLSYAAGKGMKRQEWDLALRREKVAVRQRLYAAFLAEADRQILLSLEKKSSAATAFHDVTRMFSEIELLSSDTVTAAARAMCNRVIGSHGAEEQERNDFYALKQAFIQHARAEIASYEK